MSETSPLLAPDPASPPESTNQLIVALAIVGAMTTLGLALIGAGLWMKVDTFKDGVFMIIGAFANALNVPTGIGKVLTAAKQVPQTQEKTV